MTKTFGTTPPPGGRPLRETALTLTSQALRERYDRAKEAESYALTTGQFIGKKKNRQNAMVRSRIVSGYAFQALGAEVLKMLRSGELQGIAMELGVVDAQYHEVAALHWRALTDIRWGESTARRHVENSPLFHVLIYDREAYAKLAMPDSGEMRSTTPAALAKNQTLKARFRDEFNATSLDIRTQWRTKTEAARWIRDRVDKCGGEREKRRHVLQVLGAELALLFPNSPDGITEQ